MYALHLKGRREGGKKQEWGKMAMHIKTVRVWPEPIITINLILCVWVPSRNRNLASPSFAYQLLGLPITIAGYCAISLAWHENPFHACCPTSNTICGHCLCFTTSRCNGLFPTPDKDLQTTLPWSGCFLHLSPPPVLHLAKPCASSKTHVSPCLWKLCSGIELRPPDS